MFLCMFLLLYFKTRKNVYPIHLSNYMQVTHVCIIYRFIFAIYDLFIYDFVRNCFVLKYNLDKLYIVFNLFVDLPRETELLAPLFTFILFISFKIIYREMLCVICIFSFVFLPNLHRSNFVTIAVHVFIQH